jgi:hypothetical protein
MGPPNLKRRMGRSLRRPNVNNTKPWSVYGNLNTVGSQRPGGPSIKLIVSKVEKVLKQGQYYHYMAMLFMFQAS